MTTGGLIIPFDANWYARRMDELDAKLGKLQDDIEVILDRYGYEAIDMLWIDPRVFTDEDLVALEKLSAEGVELTAKWLEYDRKQRRVLEMGIFGEVRDFVRRDR